MKLVLLSLIVAATAQAAPVTTTTPATPTTVEKITPAADGKVHFETWAPFDQVTAPLQVLNLEKTKPELYTVTVNYNIPTDSKVTENTLWRTVYVTQYARPRLAEWLQCVSYDPETHSCPSLLNIDFKNFKSKEKELKTIATDWATRAQQLKTGFVFTTYINGGRYDLPLAYGQLLNEVNPLLPKDKQITGMTKYETTKMYAVGNETGFGTLDPALMHELKRWIPNLTIETVPVNSKKANELLASAEADGVPAYIFDKSSVRNAAVQRLTVAGRATVRKSGYGMFDYKGQITEVRLNGQEKPNTLDLWVMAQCPYGVKAERAYEAAVEQKLVNPDVKVNLHYIVSEGTVDGKTQWNSLHGETELQEDIRQLAIQKTWPDKIWKYLEARNADLSADWKTAATTVGLNPTEVEAKMPVGKKLLAQDIKDGKALKVNGSPTYLWQNRIILSAPEAFKASLGYNPSDVKITTPANNSKGTPTKTEAAAPAGAKCG